MQKCAIEISEKHKHIALKSSTTLSHCISQIHVSLLQATFRSITSAGRLPDISIPRNKELIRIYRDVELVESLGSDIPRILRAYGEDCFKFTDNFIRITLPISAHDHASDHASGHASIQVEKLVSILTGEMGRSELQGVLSIKNRDYFRTDYLNPAISNGYIELTIPDKPNSQNQKYRLIAKGVALKNNITSNK